MIELTTIKSAKGKSHFAKMVVDGEVLGSEGVLIVNTEEGKSLSVILDKEAGEELASRPFSDFSNNIHAIHLAVQFPLLEEDAISHTIAFDRDETGEIYISLGMIFGVESWKKLWSITEYRKEFKTIFGQQALPDISWMRKGFEYINLFNNGGDTIGISTIVHDTDTTIIEEARKLSGVIKHLHKLVEASLMEKLRSNSVVMQFDFPEEVRVPCEQYLLYFAQFLRDLGVQADTALTHEAGQVLFTVTPDDKQQALDNIRTALEVYLHLPSSPVSDTQQSEVAILRLNSELQSFHSKLSLARAEIQMKEATIQLQQVTIARLTGEVVIDSLKDVTPKPNDKEELLGDMVSLVPIKGKGFEVNLPEIFRKLKQLFKDKENQGGKK